MTNKKTIKKVLDELAKEKPDLSYIRGMLEVLMDEDDNLVYSKYIPTTNFITTPSSVTGTWASSDSDGRAETSDEASILDARARQSLQTIKNLAEQSSE